MSIQTKWPPVQLGLKRARNKRRHRSAQFDELHPNHVLAFMIMVRDLGGHYEPIRVEPDRPRNYELTGRRVSQVWARPMNMKGYRRAHGTVYHDDKA